MSNIQDMNNRIKQNRAQRPSNRAKFKENNREAIYSAETKSKGHIFKTVPENELNDIKKRIGNRAKAERRRELIIFGIVVFFLMLAVLGILFWTF